MILIKLHSFYTNENKLVTFEQSLAKRLYSVYMGLSVINPGFQPNMLTTLYKGKELKFSKPIAMEFNGCRMKAVFILGSARANTE